MQKENLLSVADFGSRGVLSCSKEIIVNFITKNKREVFRLIPFLCLIGFDQIGHEIDFPSYCKWLCFLPIVIDSSLRDVL